MKTLNSDIEKILLRIKKFDLKTKQNAISEKEKEKNEELLDELENQKIVDENNLVEMTKYIQKAVQDLCQERKQRIKMVSKKKESLSDLQKMTLAVQALQEQPSSDQIYSELSKQYKQFADDIKRKKDSLNSQLEESRKDYESALEESKSRELQLKEIQNEISDIEGRLKRRDESISCYDHDISDLNEQREEIEREISKLEMSKKGINDSIEILSKALESFQQKTNCVGARLKKENDKYSELTKFLLAFNNDCDQKMKDITEELENEEKEVLQKVKQIINIKQNEVESLQENISQAATDTHNIMLRIDELEKERQDEANQINLMNENSKILYGAMQQIMTTISNPNFAMDVPITAGRDQ
ncbi:hypothetical protein TRFO_16934 [Tritrichomonas foetus]|uniref:Uncharacterized protein n=1 Tax=Tritrichomonas foetus TaxID=1144522 RepID=A0A1J4KNW6_9EUKA|nr:hypothetical protein TRFO_16934 [Tritrichomonas foetus]|eukprot:OHT12985.1 hypothetical protein TRFO_16934 [Tritrichomonas foetus]